MKKRALDPSMMTTPVSTLGSSLGRGLVSGIASGLANALNKVEEEQAGLLFGADERKSPATTLSEIGLLLKYRSEPLRIIPARKEEEYILRRLKEELERSENAEQKKDNNSR